MQSSKKSITILFSIVLILVMTNIAFAASPYSYLTPELTKKVELTYADYVVITLTAYYNCVEAITNKIVKQSLRCYLTEETVDVYVDTFLQDSWPVYISGTQFVVPDDEIIAAYQAAGDVIASLVISYFGGIDFSKLRVLFSINKHDIGIYQKGIFALTSSK